MLDAIGLTRKDREGFRLRRDNGQRLRIEIAVGQTLSATWPQQAEMISQHWRDIGIATDVKVMERSLWYTRAYGDKHQIALWTNNGTESLYLYPRYVLPVDPIGGVISNVYAAWFASNGSVAVSRPIPRCVALALMRVPRPASRRPSVMRRPGGLEDCRGSAMGIGLVGLSPAFMGCAW